MEKNFRSQSISYSPSVLVKSEEPASAPASTPNVRCLGDDGCGHSMYVSTNGIGGYIFISSESGQIIWDTSRVSRGQLLKALDYHTKLPPPQKPKEDTNVRSTEQT